MTIDDSDLNAAVRELVGALCAVTDVTQRTYALANRLRKASSSFVVEVFQLIRERTLLGDDECRKLYNSLIGTAALTDVFGKEKMSEIVDVAQELGAYEIVALFLDLPPEALEESPFQPFLDARLRETPLGMRKALARKLDFTLIKQIARDQDPRVIGILLNNPRLTESDVVRIGATRPTSPRVLEEIAKHPRWNKRYSVKKTIVLNPYSPLSMALRFLPYMTVVDLGHVLRAPELHPVLVQEAERIIARKSQQYAVCCGCSE
jgi:hypothetical protein